jgi:hypothetical protein
MNEELMGQEMEDQGIFDDYEMAEEEPLDTSIFNPVAFEVVNGSARLAFLRDLSEGLSQGGMV